MQEEYSKNSNFKQYVDRYCQKHKIDIATALTHELVRQVYLSYTGQDTEPIMEYGA